MWVEQREQWFIEGAAALRLHTTAIGQPDALPPTGEYYACPCCMGVYGREAVHDRTLTYEDVPPKSVGGRPLLLTCKRCNHTAGNSLDAHARGREDQHDFLAGRAPGRALDARFTIGDAAIQGHIRRVGDAWLLFVDPKRNNPAHLADMNKTLDAWAAGDAPGGPMGFELTRRVNVVRARLSWVRAAYLVAFAALGWRYVCRPCLDPLRAQLADPEAKLLPPLALLDPGASPERRQLIVVQEPDELRSLAVMLGQYTVFLPSFMGDPQPFDVLAPALARFSALAPPRPQYVGKQVPWPTKPMYVLDQADGRPRPQGNR